MALSVGIVGATVLWLIADLGVIPNPVQMQMDSRVELAKLVMIEATSSVEKNRLFDFDEVIDKIVANNDDLISIGVERSPGNYLSSIEGHKSRWNSDGFPSSSRVSADVHKAGRKWGQLQILFDPNNELIRSSWTYPLSPVFFLFASLTLATWMMMSQTFRYLNPSKVVPNRVRSALDTLAEGLVLLDPKGEVVHTNTAFGEMVDRDPEKLIGSKLEEHQWATAEEDNDTPPWVTCLQSKEPIRGRIVELTCNNASKKYIVNSSPVYGGGEKIKGALISFDDVTALERKKNELADIIQTLRQSRDEVARQNEELYFLANCDPLTKCFNRRSFWNQYSEMWDKCETGQLNLIMVDIDHFKSINDKFGHSTGDDVLRENGELLREVVGEHGTVCRYGGEEFVILLPNMEFDAAIAIANSIHKAFQKVKLGGLSVTASLGVSNTALGVMDMQHLLDQADQCLYSAKRNGRNQVVRYDQCKQDTDFGDPLNDEIGASVSIKYSTVTGLLSALAFKCARTAEHSVRVADLCVAVGQKMVSKRDLYRLEVCGLLHDIGKIGVPDRILNKPGPLTDEEWKTMRKHDEYGVSIVRSAFESDEMAEIVRLHKDSYAMQSTMNDGLLQSNNLPIESRIITACDAFDAMIGNRVYRQSQSIEDAVNELIRCTPDQFDPDVVKQLIAYVSQPGFLSSRQVSLQTSPKAAVAIAKHFEDFHSALANENVRDLKVVVENLKLEATNCEIGEISDAAVRLEEAMEEDGSKLSQVMAIAEEVMQLCRSTRSSIVGDTQPESDQPKVS